MAETPQEAQTEQPKVVSLATRDTPRKPHPQPNTLKDFRNRTPDICRHITRYGEIEDRGELYEATTVLLTQLGSLFTAVGALHEAAEETHLLCMLGEDLAAEAYRRVTRLHAERE